jgi:hypothetical protein
LNLINIGIPLPLTPPAGAVINVCGIAYAEVNNSSDFGTYLSYFSCDYRDNDGNYPVVTLFDDSTTSTFDNKTTCFEKSYTVIGNEGLSACDTFFIFGMNADGGSPDYDVKFTYKISISYSCTE